MGDVFKQYYCNGNVLKEQKKKQGAYGTSTIGEVTVYGKALRNSGEYNHISAIKKTAEKGDSTMVTSGD